VEKWSLNERALGRFGHQLDVVSSFLEETMHVSAKEDAVYHCANRSAGWGVVGDVHHSGRPSLVRDKAVFVPPRLERPSLHLIDESGGWIELGDQSGELPWDPEVARFEGDFVAGVEKPAGLAGRGSLVGLRERGEVGLDVTGEVEAPGR
jgi:hypothetical protein